MEAAIVTSVSVQVLAATRDQCLAKMDATGAGIKEMIGGMPWVVSDDDLKKMPSQTTIKDDQGMCYVGQLTMRFTGPFVRDVTHETHEGYDVQKGVGQ